jgi:hypothetical protein
MGFSHGIFPPEPVGTGPSWSVKDVKRQLVFFSHFDEKNIVFSHLWWMFNCHL